MLLSQVMKYGLVTTSVVIIIYIRFLDNSSVLLQLLIPNKELSFLYKRR